VGPFVETQIQNTGYKYFNNYELR